MALTAVMISVPKRSLPVSSCTSTTFTSALPPSWSSRSAVLSTGAGITRRHVHRAVFAPANNNHGYYNAFSRNSNLRSSASTTLLLSSSSLTLSFRATDESLQNYQRRNYHNFCASSSSSSSSSFLPNNKNINSVWNTRTSCAKLKLSCWTHPKNDNNFSVQPLSTQSNSQDDSQNSVANQAIIDKSKLRIAIVGGGAAGMSTALHLSPLVAANLISPVDLYEASPVHKCHSKNHHGGLSSVGGKQKDSGSGAIGRDIGVGIWSTAWEPFLTSLEESSSSSSSSTNVNINNHNNKASNGNIHMGNDPLEKLKQQKYQRPSYVTLLRDLEACGSYVKDVGYRTPDGTWLVRSVLNDDPYGIQDILMNNDANNNSSSNNNDESSKKRTNNNSNDPALLFVREKDLLSCLRNAIYMEQSCGTINYHPGVRVNGLDERLDGDLGSLILNHQTSKNSNGDDEAETTTDATSPPYHLIIAADGLNSSLRSRYAGHHSHNTTTTGIDTDTTTNTSAPALSETSTIEYQWEHTKGQREATQVEDRKYIVFRGNAPKLNFMDEDGSGSFQTWGEERSMRFAAVPFRHACDGEDDGGDDNEETTNGAALDGPSFKWKRKDDEEVWFATISDPLLYDTYKTGNGEHDTTGKQKMTMEQRKQFLLEAFGSWHKPVRKLIESTPAEDIMYEMAVAHRYTASPVVDVAKIMEFERWRKQQKAAKAVTAAHGDGGYYNENDTNAIQGPGPILVFVGDSCMTIDPVLAQGFTIAMEAGASLASSVESIAAATATSPPSSTKYHNRLKDELLHRHTLRNRRLLQLLRSTELVQVMAQPHGVMGGFLARWVVRPVMRYCPDVVKKGVFDFMIRYSLGLTGNKSKSGSGRR